MGIKGKVIGEIDLGNLFDSDDRAIFFNTLRSIECDNKRQVKLLEEILSILKED